MKEVILSPSQVFQAAMVGVMRQAQNLKNGRRDAYGAAADNGWQLHIEGCCGELVVAKYLGIFWDGSLGLLDADDVGPVQVRTRSRHNYDLIVHPNDPDDRWFVLVTGVAPRFVIRGYILGREAKNKQWWKDPAGGRPAFFVPQRALKDPEGLVNG